MFEKPTKDIFSSPKQDKPSSPKQDTPKPKKVATPRLVSLRMSKRAKRRILSLHAQTRQGKQDIFRELLGQSSLTFLNSELRGHDSKEKLNVVLDAGQLERLRAAAKSHQAPLSVITSALILGKSQKDGEGK